MYIEQHLHPSYKIENEYVLSPIQFFKMGFGRFLYFFKRHQNHKTVKKCNNNKYNFDRLKVLNIRLKLISSSYLVFRYILVIPWEIVIQTKGPTRLVMFVLIAHLILQVFLLWNLLNVFWSRFHFFLRFFVDWILEMFWQCGTFCFLFYFLSSTIKVLKFQNKCMILLFTLTSKKCILRH